jgi:hypothetical protein
VSKIIRKNKFWIIAAVAVISLGVLVLTGVPQGDNREMLMQTMESAEGLHWHPKLAIYVDGEKKQVPANVCITIVNVIDTDVIGMRMSPTHTHYEDDVIHMEQMKPNEETVTLGYFFKVWGKNFNQSCVLEYCASDGRVEMFVNGDPNSELGDYKMKEGDEIEIRLDSSV